MADTTLNRIAAARRAMEQVVVPAVDPTHPLAREQAELVAGTLRLLEEQLPFARERSAYELRRNIELGRELLGFTAGEMRTELTAAVSAAEEMVRALGPSTHDIEEATARLTAVGSAVVRSAADLTPEARTDLVRRVLDHARSVIAGQRAWFAGQGWGAAGVPPIGEAFLEQKS